MEKRILRFNDPPPGVSQQQETATATSSITFEVLSIPEKPVPQMQILVNPSEE